MSKIKLYNSFGKAYKHGRYHRTMVIFRTAKPRDLDKIIAKAEKDQQLSNISAIMHQNYQEIIKALQKTQDNPENEQEAMSQEGSHHKNEKSQVLYYYTPNIKTKEKYKFYIYTP